MEMMARRSIVAALILGILLSGCSPRTNAEATEFCRQYLGMSWLDGNPPREDARVWTEDVVGSLIALADIVPPEIEDPFDLLREAIRPMDESPDGRLGSERADSQQLRDAAARIDSYLETECGWPAWPPTPGYRNERVDPDVTQSLLTEPAMFEAHLPAHG